MMREWDDTADRRDTLGLKAEFTVLLTVHLLAIWAAVDMVTS